MVLSRRIKRTSDLLKVGASDQVSEYEDRFQSLRGLYDRLLSDSSFQSLVIKGLKNSAEVFRSSKVQFTCVYITEPFQSFFYVHAHSKEKLSYRLIGFPIIGISAFVNLFLNISDPSV